LEKGKHTFTVNFSSGTQNCDQKNQQHTVTILKSITAIQFHMLVWLWQTLLLIPL